MLVDHLVHQGVDRSILQGHEAPKDRCTSRMIESIRSLERSTRLTSSLLVCARVPMCVNSRKDYEAQP